MTFVICLTADGRTPAQAFDQLLDLRQHSAIVPFTRVVEGEVPAKELRVGSRFTGRTVLGPLRLDAVMEVVDLHRPTADDNAVRCTIAKVGRLLHGPIVITIEPTATGACVRWQQTLDVRLFGRRLPPVLTPLAARVAQLAYRTMLRRLLAVPTGEAGGTEGERPVTRS